MALFYSVVRQANKHRAFAVLLLGGIGCLLNAAVLASEKFKSFDLMQTDLAEVQIIDPAQVAAVNPYDSATRYQRVLIAIKLDGREAGLLDVLREDSRWWLPLEQITSLLAIKSRAAGANLVLETPGGKADIPTNELRLFEGELYTSLEHLNDHLKLQAVFDRAAYAINLSLPWEQPGRPVAGKSDISTPTPDRTPPPVSLRQLRLDYFFQDAQDYDSSQRLEYTLSGRAQPGIWYLEVEDDLDRNQQELREYYWLSTQQNAQYLLGKQDVGLHPLLPNFELSGVQALYSTTTLPDDSYNDLTRNQFARLLGRQLQDISGRAEPGSFVQLRVNGQITAVERAKLDGSYQFLGVELSPGQFNQIEVYVIDHISRQLLEVQDLSRSYSRALFDEAQHVFAVGIGKEGNALGSTENSGNNGNFLQWRGGLNERLTLEAIYSDNGYDDYQLLGATMAIGPFFSASLATAFQDEQQAWRAELNGRDKKSLFNYTADIYEEGYLFDEKRFDHILRYRYFYAPNLHYGVEGRYQGGNGIDDTQFLKPAVFWSPTPATSMSAWPNSTGHYRYDLRYRTKNFWSLSLSQEQSIDRMELRHSPVGPLSYYLNATHSSDTANYYRANYYEVGSSWSPYDHRNLRLGVALLLDDDGDEGVRLQWDQQLMPGVYSRLLWHDSDNTDAFERGWRVDWQLTLDLALAGNKIIPADTQSAHNTSGAVAGQLICPPGKDGCNKLTSATLLFNGIAYTADVSARGAYYLSGIEPGLYLVRMDTAHLPLEWVPDKNSYWVRVERGAVTRADFSLYAEYSISGKVIDQRGKGLPKVQLAVFDKDNQLIDRWWTDQFGYYRGGQLKPGLYYVKLEAVDDKKLRRAHYRIIEIKDDFLFDQYFILSDGELD